MEFPSNIKYHAKHTWAKVEGDVATIGITNYAQGQLGEILYVDLPDAGKKIKQGEVFGSVESAKVVSDLYAPLSGEVIEVNGELEDSPELVNESPYDKGWMIKVKIDDMGELDNLMDNTAYEKSL
ncbi:glycine cleavage system protein GcvH [Calorimonas adulescens]|jgi:glycine cleavage system H protein|uniref:Glycine cleavage system H protein n=1 Tax=Calorimonas adulescens TaxID=2606906 RepID=A0A5D8Q816_9THEO|nr:glycine cleavage system protein GcvH [Calorimonas adulescens]TZE80612.1 glycine cleavage system protein GcvH [Calorimonas adulescens]